MKIVIVSSKGGSTKTTTAMMLAMALSLLGLRVAVWDADPQGDATGWAEDAIDNDDPLPFDVTPVNARAVRRAVPANLDYVIVDTNPHTPDVVQAAIDSCDYAIIPTVDSPRDMARTWQTLDTVAHRPHRVLVARAEVNTRAFRNTRAALDADLAPRFQTVIHKAVALKTDSVRTPRALYGYDDVAAELLQEIR